MVQWTVAANYIKSQEPSGLKCLSAEMDQAAQAGSLITTNDCNANDPLQNLHYDATSGLITHVPTGLCVDANAAFPFDFCSKGNHSTWLICNPLADIDARAADIVSRLSLTDKIASLGTSSPALPSINLPPYNWWSEAAHGISHVTYNDRTPFASNTVLPITASQAFNRSLWKVRYFFMRYAALRVWHAANDAVAGPSIISRLSGRCGYPLSRSC